MAKVFLSYANEDRERLTALVERLEAANFTVFWDRDVPPGGHWRQVLDVELREAASVVVAWSQRSVISDWVLEEAEEARARLVPVLLDKVTPPMGFRAVQALDLTRWDGSPKHALLDGLVAALERRTSTPSLEPQVAPLALPPPNHRRRSIHAALAAALSVAALVSIWFAAHKRPDPRPPRQAVTGAASVPGPIAALAPPGPPANLHDTDKPNYRRVYFENFEEREGVSSIWLLGKRGDWKGELVDKGFRLCNVSGSASASYTSTLRYTEGQDRRPDQSDARMTLTVRLEPPVTKNSAAGMLFRNSAERESYFAFALSAGHTLMYLQKSGNHIKIASTWTLDGIADGDPVTLRIEGHGKDLWLFVKDKRIDVVADAGGSGDPGVFAMGRVCARFDDVSVALPRE